MDESALDSGSGGLRTVQHTQLAEDALHMILGSPFGDVESVRDLFIREREFEQNKWLPGMDSNHDSRLQRPLSYH
jgi:hypothetical protein